MQQNHYFAEKKQSVPSGFAETYGLTPQSLLPRKKASHSFNLNLHSFHSQGNTTQPVIASTILIYIQIYQGLLHQ